MTLKNKKRAQNSDSDEDDTFYYRYPSTSVQPSSTSVQPSATTSRKPSSSSTLAPSKSTIYVSNIDYTLTNSDLHTLFSTFGKIARVTVLKDRVTRQSRGVAFIQYVTRLDAHKAADQMNGKVLNGRSLKASIAADNGRATEFIRKRVYKDKSRCYECGGEGHLSYECPRNQLGDRERPVEKKGRKGGGSGNRDGGDLGSGDEGDRESVFEEENWASVVDGGAEERLMRAGDDDAVETKKKKKDRKVGYFSDESGEDE